MPSRRVFRLKARVEPLTSMQWRFFLCRDVADFDRLNTNEVDSTGEFFWLYWVDHWRECYAEHKEEIEAEWQRRGWTARDKAFVMTPYRERGIVLARDREREERRQRRLENERKDAGRGDAGSHRPHEAILTANQEKLEAGQKRLAAVIGRVRVSSSSTTRRDGTI